MVLRNAGHVLPFIRQGLCWQAEGDPCDLLSVNTSYLADEAKALLPSWHLKRKHCEFVFSSISVFHHWFPIAIYYACYYFIHLMMWSLWSYRLIIIILVNWFHFFYFILNDQQDLVVFFLSVRTGKKNIKIATCVKSILSYYPKWDCICPLNDLLKLGKFGCHFPSASLLMKCAFKHTCTA